MQRITRVGVLSMGKVMGGAGLFLGLLFGGLYGIIFAIMGAVGLGQGEEEAVVGLVVGLGFCLGGPIVYGLLSFVMGLLYALILNLVFKYTGGLELEIQPAQVSA
jgi:hypothetical protein